MDVVYNASNNELVRTKTLVKNAIVQVDGTPFKQFYARRYGLELGKKGKQEIVTEGKSYNVKKKLEARRERTLSTRTSESSSSVGACWRASLPGRASLVELMATSSRERSSLSTRRSWRRRRSREAGWALWYCVAGEWCSKTQS